MRLTRVFRCGAAAWLAALVSLSASTATADHHHGHGKKKPNKRAALVDVAETYRPLRSRAGRIDPQTRTLALDRARDLDRVVNAMHAANDVEPNPGLTDEQFVRRIYLDICGTIPTLDEVEGFLRQRGDDKRTRLIDKLLNSEGYVDHFYNYWSDVFRIQKRPSGDFYAYHFTDWLKEQLRDNVPFDEWVRAMLAADGKYLENPEAGYLLRDKDMTLIGVGNTTRAFLSTRVECAQCHDHPFDVWTQKDFLQLAAFAETARMRAPRKKILSKEAEKLFRNPQDFGVDPRKRNPLRQFMNANLIGAFGNDGLRLRYPKDYAYDDAKPKQLVKPAVIYGETDKTGKTWREAFADWVVADENDRFAKTIANRLWRRNFGLGVVEPFDDFRDGVEPVDGDLFEHLAGLMRAVDYDLKEFQRVLYNSDAYQRRASSRPPGPDEPYYFPGPVLRRMTAEQVWDSFLTLTVVDPYDYRQPSYEPLREARLMDLETATPQEIVERWRAYEELRKGFDNVPRKYKYKGVGLIRASEMLSPIRPDHFLMQFGQGTRENVEARNEDASVPQILTMFNGPVTHMLLEEGAVMYQVVARARNDADRLNHVFLTVLARLPSRAERSIATKEIKENGPAGLGNVIWSLVNTREFLFVQ